MRLFLLTALTMTAFAANSVLNRVGVSLGAMAPLDFAMIRVWSGAVTLLLLIAVTTRRVQIGQGSVVGTASLLVYMLGFSLAYLTLETGVGALILFGMVQFSMFVAALRAGEQIRPLRYAGCGVAFVGLAVLLWPSGISAPDPLGAALMVAAGVGWGVYSLVGRGAAAPLRLTGANFVYAAGVLGVMAVLLGLPSGTALGYVTAVLSGAVSSALGYALWYRVLPLLAVTTAAVAQLTVPLIAFAGGVVFLDEALTWRFTLACVLVLGGIALALRRS